MSQNESTKPTTVLTNDGETRVNIDEYMKFSDAAKALGVRFQQVYQRAVVRSKMQWVEIGKAKWVLQSDVDAWAKVRKEYFAKTK